MPVPTDPLTHLDMILYLSGTISDEFKSWPLDKPTIGLGRSSKSSIQIVDPTVSKDHAQITVSGDECMIRDLGSRNGTRVNGEPLEGERRLRAGDLVEIGHVPLRVSSEVPAPPANLSESTSLGSSLRIPVQKFLEPKKVPSAGTAILHLLAEAGQLLVLPRPLKETCDEILKIVERAIPSSRLVLLLRDLQGDPAAEPVQIAARYRGGSAAEPLVMSRAIMRVVLEENTSVLTTDAALDPRFAGAHSIVSQAVHSAMAVPLFDNERVLGLVYADHNDLLNPYGEEHLEVLTILANMAAVKITNARLLEAEQAAARLAEELATARRIQRSLLPATPPQPNGYAFDVTLETCYEVGGDLYDFHVGADGCVFFLLGDVSGKGMGAALLMSSVVSSARVLYEGHDDPASLMRRLNAITFQNTDPKHFVTAFLGKLDPAAGVLHYVNAGHPPPLMVTGGALSKLDSTGIPLGIMADFPFESRSVELAPGALLALFTDGVSEAQNTAEEFFEEERLEQAVIEDAVIADIKKLSESLLDRVDKFIEGEKTADDITLMLLRRA